MDEFIFPIGRIFGSASNGVLEQNGCSSFYIGPYQRGYKWGSATRYEQVPQMLIDIYEALSSGAYEYYLQYITVKKNTSDFTHPVLEVIDGQQRLTTLSILFNRIAKKTADGNIAAGLLRYARYDRDSSSDIIERACQLADDSNFNCDEAPTQDEFYMVSAARCIDKFLDILSTEGKLERFNRFLRDHVMLIVNIESEFVKSEDAFANLNDNKVMLTDSYLIKGLLLTWAVQKENANGGRRNYREILDQRSIMGRTWDEIMSWISDKDVAHFFFGQTNRTNGMDSLLRFVFQLKYGNLSNAVKDADPVLKQFISQLSNADSLQSSTDRFPLFNRYNEIVRGSEVASKVLSLIKHVYLKFRGLYENHSDSSLYNLFGFVVFSERIKQGGEWVKEEDEKFRMIVLKELVGSGLDSFTASMRSRAGRLIPSMEEDLQKYMESKNIGKQDDLSADQVYEALKNRFRYKSNNPELRNLLLSFSVFPEVCNKAYRFDFCRYDLESWSFEHIFPQHPKGTLKISPVAIPAVCKAMDLEISNSEDVTRKKRLKEIKGSIAAGKTLDKEDVDDIVFLYNCDFDIDQCGNMALLSGGDNSALSNNPFIAKRLILTELAISGSFVPLHTMATFNKSLSATDGTSFSPNLSKWTSDDVQAHMLWEVKRNKEIKKELEK